MMEVGKKDVTGEIMMVGQGVKEIKKERQEQLKKKARLKYAEIVKEQ